jgi:hypothetical protein
MSRPSSGAPPWVAGIATENEVPAALAGPAPLCTARVNKMRVAIEWCKRMPQID